MGSCHPSCYVVFALHDPSPETSCSAPNIRRVGRRRRPQSVIHMSSAYINILRSRGEGGMQKCQRILTSRNCYQNASTSRKESETESIRHRLSDTVFIGAALDSHRTQGRGVGVTARPTCATVAVTVGA